MIAEGHRVAVTARSGEGPEGSLTVRAEMNDSASIDAAFTEVEAQLGAVEVVVANAGITRDTLLLRMSEEDFAEVIDTNLCTGCAGCVIACPHDVIGYDHNQGGYRPFHLEEELGPDDCIHGQKGCTACTRACPRFRAWEFQANEHLFAREFVIARVTEQIQQPVDRAVVQRNDHGRVLLGAAIQELANGVDHA